MEGCWRSEMGVLAVIKGRVGGIIGGLVEVGSE